MGAICVETAKSLRRITEFLKSQESQENAWHFIKEVIKCCPDACTDSIMHLTIPVKEAMVKRTLSKLKTNKNYLQVVLDRERLSNNLALFSIEKC